MAISTALKGKGQCNALIYFIHWAVFLLSEQLRLCKHDSVRGFLLAIILEIQELYFNASISEKHRSVVLYIYLQ